MVPTLHYADIFETAPKVHSVVTALFQRVAVAARTALNASGANILSAHACTAREASDRLRPGPWHRTGTDVAQANPCHGSQGLHPLAPAQAQQACIRIWRTPSCQAGAMGARAPGSRRPGDGRGGGSVRSRSVHAAPRPSPRRGGPGRAGRRPWRVRTLRRQRETMWGSACWTLPVPPHGAPGQRGSTATADTDRSPRVLRPAADARGRSSPPPRAGPARKGRPPGRPGPPPPAPRG